MLRSFLHSCLLLSTLSLASAQNVRWVTPYVPGDYELAYDVAETSEGGFVAVGVHAFYTAELGRVIRALIVKCDSDGNTLWRRQLDTFDGSGGRRVISFADVTHVVAGVSHRESNAQILVASLDSGGVVHRQQVFTGIASYGGLADAEKVGEESFYVLAVGPTATVLKFRKGGDLIWRREYSCVYQAQSLAVTRDGGFVLAGASHTNGYDVVLQRCGPNGDSLWCRRVETPEQEGNPVIQANEQGGYSIAGMRNTHPYLITVDSNGFLIGNRDVASAHRQLAFSDLQLRGSQVILMGHALIDSGYRMNISRLSSHGDLLSERLIVIPEPPAGAFAFKLLRDGYIVAGIRGIVEIDNRLMLMRLTDFPSGIGEWRLLTPLRFGLW